MVVLGWLLHRLPKDVNRALYAGKTIMHGHKVTFSNKKTKRTWHPNIQSKKYFSAILNTHLKLHMTTAAMRWIDKAGGFDSYIYHTPDRKLASDLGIALKKRMHAVVRNHPDNVAPPPRVRRIQRRPIDEQEVPNHQSSHSSNTQA